MGQPDPMGDIQAAFYEECDELLEVFQDGMDLLAQGGGSMDTIHALFRAVHSIKGGAATLGMSTLTERAHALETQLDGLRQAQSLPTLDQVGTLLRLGDALAQAAGAPNTAPDPAPATAPDGPVLAHLAPTSLTEDAVEIEAAFDALTDLSIALQVEADLSLLPDLDSFDPEGTHISWHLRIAPEDTVDSVLDCLHHLPPSLGVTVDHACASPQPNTAAAPSAEVKNPKTIRVDLDRIDGLVNLVGELVINHATLAQANRTTASGSDAELGLDEFLRLTHELQDCVMKIRAQPVKPLFQRMGRIARETAQSLGKTVEMELDGAETELDKTVIEKLTEPLTHMIRNAVDHGIEATADRLSSGKNPEGKVTLRAYHRSGRVLVELSDDGAGINRPAVLKKAVKQGLIGETASLSDAEIDALLFHPGFSTAQTLSDVSGRGVGMDVVRAAIQSIGGRLRLESTPGHGTRFLISLPLTLAVLEAMVLDVEGHKMVLPLAAIQETLIIDESNLIPFAGGRELIRHGDRVLGLVDVAAVFGFAPSNCEDYVALIITGDDTDPFAIRVNAILEQRQVVVKGLQDGLPTHPSITSATILGDGSIALIFDPYDLRPKTAVKPAAPSVF